MGAKDKLREFLIENVGRVISSAELSRASGGASEWARRVRELRDAEGYEIATHHDRSDLRPGEYLLTSKVPGPGRSKGLSQRLRAEILERDGHTCQMCGAGAGEPDPLNPGKRVRLQVDHMDTTLPTAELNLPRNLQTKCSACNGGRKNFIAPPKRAIDILSSLRPASEDVKREIYDWLRKRYEPTD